MIAPVFVDTNVLVYARDRTDEEKHRRSSAWMAALWEAGAGRLSHQVLQEYYLVATRKLDPPRSVADARADVAALMMWRPVPIDLAVIDRAWRVEDRLGLSWWDSLIVAAAQSGGCAYLLTEDLQDGRSFDGLTVISPFTHEASVILDG